jgi:hypothetical protein
MVNLLILVELSRLSTNPRTLPLSLSPMEEVADDILSRIRAGEDLYEGE